MVGRSPAAHNAWASAVEVSLSDGALLDALAAHPDLLQRPIRVRGERAVPARPVEKARELLG